jgi:hypothetical protein
MNSSFRNPAEESGCAALLPFLIGEIKIENN